MDKTMFYIIYSTVIFLIMLLMARKLFRARRNIDSLYSQIFRLEVQFSDYVRKEQNLLQNNLNAIWSVNQAILTVTAESHTLTRDLVRCVEQAAAAIEVSTFPPKHSKIQILPVTTSGIRVEVQLNLCLCPPGFFRDSAGGEFPEELNSMLAIPHEKGKRTVTVFAQVTKYGSPKELASYLRKSGTRIEIGEQVGADYDDDSGYAFIVTPVINR